MSILWNPSLALIPAMGGVLCATLALLVKRDMSTLLTFGCALFIILIAPISIYVGTTSLMDINDIIAVGEPGAFVCLLGAVGIFSLGYIVIHWITTPIRQMIDAQRLADYLD